MGKQITPELQRSCLDKVKYKTEAIAQAKATELANLKHPLHKVRHLKVYKCEYCPNYHLTKKG